MRKYIAIGIGGCFGAILRYLIKFIPISDALGSIPYNTLIVNVLGCFLLALILTAALQLFRLDANIRLGIATGFLGAFTTLSTFCKETAILLTGGFYFSGIVYIVLTLFLGFGAGYLGIILANQIVRKRTEKNASDESGV